MRTFLQAEASVFMGIADGKRERALSACQVELWKTGLQRRPGRCGQRQPASRAKEQRQLWKQLREHIPRLAVAFTLLPPQSAASKLWSL